MAEIKLIALDLDGTLLDSQKRLSSKNESILKECIRQGIWVVPCTGRIWGGVPDFLRDFPGIRYAITTNGAIIEDIATGEILKEHKLTCRQALDILKMAREFHTMYDVYVDGRGYGEERFLYHMEEYGVTPLVQEMIRGTRMFVPDLWERISEIGRSVEKINYFFSDMEERIRAKEALDARGDVIVSSSFSNNLEINALGATKGEGILHLAQYLGVEPDETIGIGDGGNDVTMMQMAGIGVAMGNAEDSLKEIADYVTLTNDEDGVAFAIEKLIWGR